MPDLTSQDPITRLTPESMDHEMVLSSHLNKCFYPENLLQEMICEEVVTLILQKYDLAVDKGELTRFICAKAKRVFAILVCYEKVAMIEPFFKHKFTDAMLPVKQDEASTDSTDIESFYADFSSQSIVKATFKDAKWNYRTLRNFYANYQWPFVSPVFTSNHFRYTLHAQHRLPFVDEECKDRKVSYFSVVEKWRIHRDHLQIDGVWINSGSSGKHPYAAVRELRQFPLKGVEALSTAEAGGSDHHPIVALKELKKLSLSNEEFIATAETEATNLEELRELNHPHLIRAIAYFIWGKQHFFMFPWANLGNLRDFCSGDPPPLHPTYLEWIFGQLCGLSGAISKLHHSEKNSVSWRHGDLKPDNILCFGDSYGSQDRRRGTCTFVITDVGLTKKHNTVTEDRKNATRTQSGTVMYEPPEAELDQHDPKKGRSRRYDIWSMGCIYLELIIWLFYGAEELKRFRNEIDGNRRFYVLVQAKDSTQQGAELHNMVQKWIDWIRNDARCSEESAIRRLLDLIVSKLLVPENDQSRKLHREDSLLLHAKPGASSSEPPLSPSIIRTATSYFESSDDQRSKRRVTAKDMEAAMKSIFGDATKLGLSRIEWLRFDAPTQKGPGQYAKQLASSDANLAAASSNRIQQEYRFTPLDDHWEYAPDIEISSAISEEIIQTPRSPRVSRAAELCYRCSSLELWRPKYTFIDTLAGLKKKSWNCALCRLLLTGIKDSNAEPDDKIQFQRISSFLFCGERLEKPLASLCIDSWQKSWLPGIPVGFPRLYEPGNIKHVKTLARWISSCDHGHQCLPINDVFLPTRVLDVGEIDSIAVHLVCTLRDQGTPGKYLALSHRWGSSSAHRRFCTFKSNIEDFKRGIAYSNLPATFQHAVQITRSLGIRYLWIDSLCIVQDDSGDWDRESQLMEQVFSSAYVTIAATCATGTDDGFLQRRPERQNVAMARGDDLYYVCEAIDNFHQDVNHADLNKRGWVLQERALSRRTIHFTERQSYWECGEGVRCETLTKMKNRKASFLGDANFPQSVESYVKGMKIELIQDLYSRYSNLALSFSADRPIAIRGLEKRLTNTLNTTGSFGIFDIYRHRCLLWRRAGSNLKRIGRFRGETVPTWSWMAYEGGINYLDVPYGRIDWTENIAVVSRWRKLKAPVHQIVDQQNAMIILDEPSRNLRQSLQCIVVGTSKKSRVEEQGWCYVLLVLPIAGMRQDEYERVGVGQLKQNQIALNESCPVVSIL